MGSTNRKKEMSLSKQSLIVPRQDKSRVRETGMNGSVVARASRRYGGSSFGKEKEKSKRYQSLSVDLNEDR